MRPRTVFPKTPQHCTLCRKEGHYLPDCPLRARKAKLAELGPALVSQGVRGGLLLAGYLAALALALASCGGSVDAPQDDAGSALCVCVECGDNVMLPCADAGAE